MARLHYASATDKSNEREANIIGIVALVCVACQMDKKFARLQTGVTKSQVIGILGKPNADKVENGSETLRWDAGNHYVKLRDGRVSE